MIFYIIISVFIKLVSSQKSEKLDIPSKEVIESIKKPDLGGKFFNGLVYHGSHVVFVEAGGFHIEPCAWMGAVRKIVYNPGYEWLGPNHKFKLRNPRMQVLGNGDLLMMRPHVRDSGTYFCRIINNDHKDYFQEYERSIIVFTAPAWLKEIHFHFLVPECSRKMKMHVIKATKKFFCKNDGDCLYYVSYNKCFATSEFESMKELRITVHQYLHDGFVGGLESRCGIFCINNQSKHALDSFSRGIIQELRHYMRLEHREKSKMLLLDKKTTIANIPVCITGYKLYSAKVCVPCNKGEMRMVDVQHQSCTYCGFLTYAPFFGQANCTFCPLFTVTPRFGTYKKSDCVWFFKSFYAMAILVPTLIFLSLVIGFIISLFSKGGTQHRYKCCKYFTDIFYFEDDSARDKRIQAEYKAFMEGMKAL